MKTTRTAAIALTVGMAFAAAAWAQQTPAPAESPDARDDRSAKPDARADRSEKPAPKAEPRGTKLVRVQVVIGRSTGDKKVTSLPYTLLAPTDRRSVSLRMGVEVPIVTGVGSTQYRNVGTNIDCRVDERGDGLYQIELKAENSSVYTGPGSAGPENAARAEDRPMFRTFNVSLAPVLRDGQSLQTIASTDPVTGEVVRIDVALNVVK